MSEATVLMTGLKLVESPRWYQGRLWFCDWGAQELIALDPDGTSEVVTAVQSFPFCIDPLPDGRLLVVSNSARRLLVREPDGTLADYADLGGLSDKPWNEVAVDGRGNAYVNNIGFDFGVGEPGPGFVAVVTADGSARVVAEDLAFPNGMAVTADGSTLIVAESYAGQLTAFDIEADGGLANRRVWADLGEGAAPDGICLDAENAAWYADVPNSRCVRVREGGEVVQTVQLDRGCFSCALGGPDLRTLFMVAAKWPDVMEPDGPRTGQVLTAAVSVPGISR